MNRTILGPAVACALFFAPWAATLAAGSANHQTDRLLPENFTVYVLGNGVANHPVPGAREVVLPTSNLYRGPDGGYVACYSHDAADSAYRVGDDIYVMGQVRLRGAYDGRIFQPRGFSGRDISALGRFKQVCGMSVAACRAGTCWAGGDTGGWFGIK